MVNVYNNKCEGSLVRPHLVYGGCIWGPFPKADQKVVERVQRRPTKCVPELRHKPYPERLRLLDSIKFLATLGG